MSAKKFLSDLPPTAKGILLIMLTAGAGLGTYALIQGAKKRKKQEDAKKEVDATLIAIKKLTDAGQKTTLDSLKLATISNQIVSALDGYGSDEQAIYRAFTNVNSDLDVVNLMKAYGIREISSGAGNPEPNLKGTLSQALTEELSAAEIKALNDILARKGIKYRF